MQLKTRLMATLIAIDQVFNAMICGYPDETLSAACYRKAPYGKLGWVLARKVIDKLFFFDKEHRDGLVVRHCQLSWESELSRKHFPNEYKKRV